MNALVMEALEGYAAQIVADDPLTAVSEDVLRFVRTGAYAEHLAETSEKW